ncbi:3-coathanger stack domain-containing protein, partial [Emticicia fontis]
ITGTTNLSCTTTSVTRQASGGGTYLWSNSLGTNATATITSPGTYTVTVTGTNGCTATATTSVTQSTTPPSASITGTTNLSCTTTSVTRQASGGGTYLWSNGLGTNATATITIPGTYTVTVTGTNGCTATATTSVTQSTTPPSASITGTTNLSCTTTSVTRQASGGGTYLWSNGLGTNATATITIPGTYTVTVTGSNGCTATATTIVTQNLSFTSSATNTGPYSVGQTIELNGIGNGTYRWIGPASFNSTTQNPTISGALVANGGTYTLTVVSGICTSTATTNVVVSGVDPCVQVVDLQYVKAGDPYQSMFSLKEGMVIQQIPDQVSIIANPICPITTIGSLDLTITGPEINWTILQNVQPYAVFDNLALNVYGRNFIPGTYTLTVIGYAEDNRVGGTVYGPVVTTFTVVGTMAVINAPTIPNNRLCAGSRVDVTFATTGSFDSSNTFNIQLSDTTGGFTNPILIGTSSTAGTITCQLPQNLSPTGEYLIRVASSNQVVASNPTMQYLSVTPATKCLIADIASGTRTEQASMQISAENKITSPANVTYNAGKSIILNPGFESKEGSVFKAQIQGCNN